MLPPAGTYRRSLGVRDWAARRSKMYCIRRCRKWVSVSSATVACVNSSWGRAASHMICWLRSVRTSDLIRPHTYNCRSPAIYIDIQTDTETYTDRQTDRERHIGTDTQRYRQTHIHIAELTNHLNTQAYNGTNTSQFKIPRHFLEFTIKTIINILISTKC